MSYSSPSPEGPASPGWLQISPDGPSDETEIITGADQLLSSAFSNGLSDPFDSAEGGWIASPLSVDPYTGMAADGRGINAFTGGQTVDPYSGVTAESDNPNFYTGGQNVDPITGFQNAESFTGGADTGSAAPMLAFDIPVFPWDLEQPDLRPPDFGQLDPSPAPDPVPNAGEAPAPSPGTANRSGTSPTDPFNNGRLAQSDLSGALPQVRQNIADAMTGSLRPGGSPPPPPSEPLMNLLLSDKQLKAIIGDTAGDSAANPTEPDYQVDPSKPVPTEPAPAAPVNYVYGPVVPPPPAGPSTFPLRVGPFKVDSEGVHAPGLDYAFDTGLRVAKDLLPGSKFEHALRSVVGNSAGTFLTDLIGRMYIGPKGDIDLNRSNMYDSLRETPSYLQDMMANRENVFTSIDAKAYPYLDLVVNTLGVPTSQYDNRARSAALVPLYTIDPGVNVGFTLGQSRNIDLRFTWSPAVGNNIIGLSPIYPETQGKIPGGDMLLQAVGQQPNLPANTYWGLSVRFTW